MKTIRELQASLPWTVRYSQDFRSNPQSHRDFTHALLHVGKALGKLQGLADDFDHDRTLADDPSIRKEYAKYIADLVVCALRACNTFPGGTIDLESAVIDRIETKNGVKPPRAPQYGLFFKFKGVTYQSGLRGPPETFPTYDAAAAAALRRTVDGGDDYVYFVKELPRTM